MDRRPVLSLVIQAIGLRSITWMSISLGIFRSTCTSSTCGKLLQPIVHVGEIDRKNVSPSRRPAIFKI